MTRRNLKRSLLILLLALLAIGCTRTGPAGVLIEVPASFTGQVHVEMGVPGAPPLQQNGKEYLISVPPDGKVVTSTIVPVAGTPRFQNVNADHVWGYTPAVSKAGDGLIIGGTIEFFVGTKAQYETAEAKKHKSRLSDDANLPMAEPG
jgi:hypothetical protein